MPTPECYLYKYQSLDVENTFTKPVIEEKMDCAHHKIHFTHLVSSQLQMKESSLLRTNFKYNVALHMLQITHHEQFDVVPNAPEHKVIAEHTTEQQ